MRVPLHHGRQPKPAKFSLHRDRASKLTKRLLPGTGTTREGFKMIVCGCATLQPRYAAGRDLPRVNQKRERTIYEDQNEKQIDVVRCSGADSSAHLLPKIVQ